MHTADNDATNHLDDTQLLAVEVRQRDEFKRLEEREPQFRDTTYGVVRGSPALLESWQRWWNTNLAARGRGLLNRTLGR
jgi:hypothetical protein